MRLIYLEATADEIKLRPTIMNSFLNFMDEITATIGTVDEDEEDKEEQDGTT